MLRVPLAVLALALLPLSRLAAQEADLIVIGGRVWTGDSAHPAAVGVAIADTRIVTAGSRATVLAHRGARTRLIDVPGGFVMPGFIDNHTHFSQAGGPAARREPARRGRRIHAGATGARGPRPPAAGGLARGR